MKVEVLSCILLLAAVACGETGRETDGRAFRLPQPAPESVFIERAKDHLRSVGHDPTCFHVEYRESTPVDPEWAKLGWHVEFPIANVEFTPDNCKGEYSIRVSVFVDQSLDEAKWIVNLGQLTDLQEDIIEKAIDTARTRWPTLPLTPEIIPSVSESAEFYVVTLRKAKKWVPGVLWLDGDRMVVVEKGSLSATPWQFGEPVPTVAPVSSGG